MSRFFVTSSGTEIGKTFVTAALCHALKQRGQTVRALKPVVSGIEGVPWSETDPGILLRGQGLAVTEDAVAAIAPWRFLKPLSPDMAAAREGRSIPYDEVLAFCRRGLDGPEDVVFVEGAGGVMVPLDEGRLSLDWMQDLDIPAILVVGGYLGTISHTLTAATALDGRGIPIAAIVVNEAGGPLPVPLDETAEALRRYRSGTPILTLPRCAGDEPWTQLPDVAVSNLVRSLFKG